MLDNLPPTPPPGDDHPGHPPGDYNQAQLITVTNGENLARNAQKTDYHARLVSEGMLDGAPQQLLDAATLWRRLSGLAVGATREKENSTDHGGDAETRLRREVEFYRAKARQFINRQTAWTPEQKNNFLARYAVGTDILASRPLAQQAVGDLLKHAAEDDLPGVTPERRERSAAVLAEFTGVPAEQGDAQSEATKRRAERDTAFETVMRLRHDIQYAADTGWPWWGRETLAARRDFLLPAGRPFTGT